MSNLLKNLLFILGLAVLLFLGYMVFLRDSVTTSTGSLTGATAEEETQALLDKIQRIQTYSADSPIFDNQSFKSLTSFQVDIPEEPTGRSNPFAPVE